jgi:hypothetical protein
MDLTLVLLHLLTLWPLAFAVPFIRRSNKAYREHLSVLQKTPVFPVEAERLALTVAQDRHRRALRHGSIAVMCAVAIVVLQQILLVL